MSSPHMPPPPPVPTRKTSPLVWILIAVAGFVVLGGIMIAVGGFFLARTVQRAGSPAGVVRMIAAMNPDVEVVSSDESSGKITIREKKTGKTITMNFDDVKDGKIVFEEEGSGSRAVIGGGSAAKIPAWVPAYPGSSPVGNFTSSNSEQEAGQYTFKTSDSIDKVSSYYNDALKRDGYKMQVTNASDSGAFLSGRSENGKRTVVVTIGSSAGEDTTVAMAYTESK